MGTSSSATGPKSPAWSAAKSSATRLAKGRSGYTPKKVVNRAAKALDGTGGAGGGGQGWSNGSSRTAQRLGGLLGGAAESGLVEAAKALGIADLEGKPAGEALLELLDWVASDGVDLDDQAARRAAEEVLSELLSLGDEAFDQMLDAGTAVQLFRSFLVKYLTRSIVSPLAKRLTENATAARARDLERDIGRVVDALVHLEIGSDQMTTIDWLGPEGATVVQRLRDDALKSLGADEA